ncbi:hypothetical protein [Paracoccus aestuarii]|uniref:hypothetical protein n=1 Tax=Paracoccus aestuarii TaxID=453842 RepID=UPI0011C38A91|nr:hypothetical protein [Paracoccus aestuarii]WCQ99129.1 hypothetical protein JHW48_15040 [Paracoccus aestuarii]
MKKLNAPPFDRQVVRFLRSKLSDVPTAQNLWKRSDGKYRDFKNNVTATMMVAQSRRCAYCGTRLFEKRPHRDHIAPKSPHFSWAFWPTNLVLACYCCNVDCKGETDTVAVVASTYRRTIFTIVHPFVDDPTDHLNFGVAEKAILVNPKNGSAKGAETIRLFKLMDPERAKERAKDVLLDEDIEHLHGVTRDMFLAATEELRGGRVVMKA